MFRFVAVIAVALGLAVFAVSLAASSPHQTPARTHFVAPYETLWTIAIRFYRGDPREAIWRIEQANHLPNATIRPGQRLLLP